MSPEAVSRPEPRHHPAPGLGDVFRAQLALIAAPPRTGIFIGLGIILLQLVSMASWGSIIGISIHLGEESQEEVIRLTHVTDLGLAEGAGAMLFALAALSIWAVFWPNRVWRNAGGQGRSYHWAFPVDRRLHDLLRVAAGAIWLLPLGGTMLVATVPVALAFGHGAELAQIPVSAWFAFFAGPLLLYLLSCIAPLMKGRRRLLWLWLTLGAWVGLFALLGLVGETSAFVELSVGPFGFFRAIAGPFFALAKAEAQYLKDPWLPAYLVWLTVALVGVLAAASDRGRTDP